MKDLRLHIVDFWPGFNTKDNLFINLLSQEFTVLLDEERPDLLVYSCFGFNFMKYNCHRIYFTGENTRPNYLECDFSWTFDYDSYKGRNYRMPLYVFSNLAYLKKGKELPVFKTPKTKFCNMVVSNSDGKVRNTFFDKINSIKKVDSGGKYKNNLDGPVKDKLEFISEYKFSLAFENSSYPGYVTEKLIQPMLVGSIPIYWGCPKIGQEFNVRSFINVHDYPNWDAVIEEVIRLDNDDDAYAQMRNEPWLIDDELRSYHEYDEIAENLIKSTHFVLSKKPISRLTKPISIFIKYRKKIKSKLLSKPHWFC